MTKTGCQEDVPWCLFKWKIHIQAYFDYLSQVSTNSPACWNLLGRSDSFWHHQTRDTRTHTVFIVHYVLHIDTFKSHEDSPTSNWCTCTAMSAALLCIFPLYIFLVQLWSPASSFACFCMCWVGEFQGQSKVFNSVHCNTSKPLLVLLWGVRSSAIKKL